MEIPEKNYIDERFLERLRKQRLKQASELENFDSENGNETIVETSHHLDPIYFAKDSECDEVSTFDHSDYYQNDKTLISKIENQENAEDISIEMVGFLQEEVKENGDLLEGKLNNRDDFFTLSHPDLQHNEKMVENEFNRTVETVIEVQSELVEQLENETINANDNRHPNEIYRASVQQILEGKKREFIILGYETINEDLLWQYLIEKTWKRAKEAYRLHQVVADIYTIRPNDFMNHATVEVFKKSEPKSRHFSLNIESLKGLF
jgi:hypothetical protein